MKNLNHYSLLNLTFKLGWLTKAVIYMKPFEPVPLNRFVEPVRNRLKRLNTLLLNIVGLRLNDFEREVRDSELLLFFPSFIKRSILSDIFSIFSSLKKTFSTMFCSFLLKCKMYVWLEFRTWSYRVIKRHTDLDVDHLIVLILFSYCRIKQACYMWKDCLLINVINPSLSLKFYSTIKTSLNWL